MPDLVSQGKSWHRGGAEIFPPLSLPLLPLPPVDLTLGGPDDDPSPVGRDSRHARRPAELQRAELIK